MVRIAVIVLGVLLSFGANAQSLRLKNYLQPENDRIRILNEVYLAGAIDALTAYNMAAPTKLFCKEGGLVSHEEAAHLMTDWAEKQTKMPDDTLIVIPLLLLLKKTYPCP
ncbi:hypothetical protein FFI89_032840 [Bradyrhizobium sp. KBS0727]|jgi:hypothetical protein|uniref:hypothetical protein n=1 Tax=unclassified Bradyrhizobium TaxID=2631580 RepID=UPI00110D962B|nr:MULTISPECIES: hypothetical protein [unclassified Bradyrhizobium]QDW41489.1 hypothetical protein FFI71_032845 [Bradyrhizobium sp. KBS0725]QDW48095.1 hypothetical protein FFI89_032840 [Bradyrhizobium sp. KBS0727]